MDLWAKALRTASGPRYLIATSMSNYNHACVVERSLAVALTLRGARVEFLLCDAALPCCQMTKLHGCEPEALLAMPATLRCPSCVQEGKRLFEPLGLPVRWFGQHLSDAARARAASVANTLPVEDIPGYCPGELAIGEHALAGALRYYGRGDLSGEPCGEAILRRFLESSLRVAAVMDDLLDKESYDAAIFHHGIYSPQGVIGESCRTRGLRVVNWNPSYRKNTFIFSHGDTYHHTMVSEPAEAWDAIPWTERLERLTMDYLDSRRCGSADWIWFHERPENDMDAFAREFGLDWSRPVVGLLTSVMWDAQLHYKANAFPCMLAWVRHTVEAFRSRPDLQLLIRIHPAEVRGMVPSRQKMAEEIRRMTPQLPPNVFVVPPEHQASTYALMDRCDSVIIFNTKTGIELSAAGIPVVVAGEAWIRGKGFSQDASSPQDYDRILASLPLGVRLSPEKTARAKRYAFHFFFRRMLELPFIGSPQKFTFSVELESLTDLLPGRWPGLDCICEGIATGRPFIDEYELRPETR
ncbi:capsular biosynthesis protein [Humidesulfovibrio mexicanus]|nr:capsular biosynthesis protein [Humidesulfovibrio mexicanus]